jgi:hypothetical protein
MSGFSDFSIASIAFSTTCNGVVFPLLKSAQAHGTYTVIMKPPVILVKPPVILVKPPVMVWSGG